MSLIGHAWYTYFSASLTAPALTTPALETELGQGNSTVEVYATVLPPREGSYIAASPA